MPLGLNPQESMDLWDAASRQAPAGPPQPGFFAGAPSSVVSGVEEGAVKSAFALTPDSPTAPQATGLPPIGAPDWAYEKYAQTIKKAHETDPEQFQRQLAADTTQALKGFAADPQTVGTAGQILHGLASGVTRIVAGAAVGGPVAGAVAVGGSEGKSTQRQFLAEGLDANTSAALGAGAALFSGAGALLPGGLGKTALQRIASGAAIQTEVGIYSRGLTHNVLDDAGYTAQAQQYRALDGTAILSDAVLGSAFGTLHHLWSPSDIDAALTARGATQREVDLAPGIPVTPDARALHVEQLTRAAEAMMNDEPVTGMRMPETIANPVQDALGATVTRDLAEHVAEVTTEAVGAENRYVAPLPEQFYPGGLATPVKTRPIQARDNALFRETDWRGVMDLLAHDKDGGALRTFVTDDKDLAIGQSGNGVTVEYDPHMVSGEVHQKPGTGIIGGNEFSTDYVARSAIRAIHIKDGAAFDKIDPTAIGKRSANAKAALLKEFPDATRHADGSITLSRKSSGIERRADAIESQRLTELRNTPDRTPEQQAEYIRLLESDRLAAKVGGRRIEGLLSREALEEKIAAGEGFSHYAYFDLDMFKAINDEFGMQHGDEAIRAAGEAAAAIAGKGRAFKGSERAGDEFVLGGHSLEELHAQIEAIRQHLANHLIELRKDGKVVKSRRGLDFSHGIAESGAHGQETEPAAAASKLAKVERARLGFRTDRGAVPEEVPGAVRPGGGEAPAGTEAATVEALDPQTREAVDQAHEALSRRPDMTVPGETGDTASAKDALQQSMDDLSAAKQEGVLHQIAAACFGRG